MNRSPFQVDAIFALSLVELFRVVLEKKSLYGIESEDKDNYDRRQTSFY